MKKLAFAVLGTALVAAADVAASERTSKPEDIVKLIPQETKEETAKRLAWWQHDRFGLFIHFGLYAMPSRNEWVRNFEYITNEDYEKYFKRFNPDLFDARAWAKTAKAAGMRYAVLTTKHHEGFCLYDSKFTDYKITNTPFRRDLVKEYVEAFRAEGLRVGFYYSLLDWHHPDFTVDNCHPLRPREKMDDTAREAYFAKLNKGRDMAKYRQYMRDQVTELLTNYGKIDIIWFDFSYAGRFGKSRDDWDSPTLLSLARRLQPGIIVDNRLDLRDVPGGSDFATPEQVKVKKWPLVNGEKFPWETCQTFSGSWGYFRDEMSWKSDRQCLDLLIGAVAHGGNLIMNVGPTARGEFDGRAMDRLGVFAKWMHANARSIYGCTEAPEEFVAPDGTTLTYNPETKRLYIHVFEYPAGSLGLGFGSKVDYAQFLHDGSEIILKRFNDQQKAKDPNGFDATLVLPVVKPDVVVPVIELDLK